jgi:pimeloyl-ACP methyl ester carboxylesterase
MRRRLCFLHGLDSSPNGTKASVLKRHYPDCLVPSLPPDIHLRVEIVEKAVQEPMIFTGSSLGGLTAIMYAMRHPEMVNGMVLLAPAVGTRDKSKSILGDKDEGLLDSLYIPGGFPTVVIAALRDALIPVSAIRALIHRSPKPERIQLHEVYDDHDLHQSLDLMLKLIYHVQYEGGSHAQD